MQEQEWQIYHLPLESIRPNPYQPRRHMDESALSELAQSIAQYGVLQPIQVRKSGARFFELVAGERRLRAARMAGLTHIPALVQQAWEMDAAVLALVENLQREQLHYLEEAEGFINLAQEHGLTQEEIAQKVGKTQSSVANKMRLLRLGKPLREKLAEHKLTERHARALLRLTDDEKQHKALDIIIRRNLNVREAELLIERMSQKPQPKAQVSSQIRRVFRDYRLLTNTLKSAVKDFCSLGLCAQYHEEDKGDTIQLQITLPKRASVVQAIPVKGPTGREAAAAQQLRMEEEGAS